MACGIALLRGTALALRLDQVSPHGELSFLCPYASKLWSALLAAATISLLCFNRGFWLVTVALAWGILCDFEGLTMSALLPEWTHDVKSLRRAFVLRREMLARKAVQPVAK